MDPNAFWRAVRALPQFDQIDPTHAWAWYYHLHADPHAKLAWHVNRLDGFGGSETGVFLAHEQGGGDPFSTPRDIVAGKLLRRMPTATTPQLRRGTLLEDDISTLFHEQTGATSCDDRLSELRQRPCGEPTWLRGEPDDLVSIDHQVYLVDYKAPSHPPSSVPLRYAAQLHHYRLLARRVLGLEPSMLLASFDYEAGRVRVDPVPHDPELDAAILRIGDRMWQHVMSGTLPEPTQPKPKAHELSLRERLELRTLEARYIRTRLIEKAASQRKGQLADRIRDQLEPTLNGDGDSVSRELFGALTIQVRERWDQDRIVEVMRRRGEDPDRLLEAGDQLDQGAMAQRLLELGEDLTDFLEQAVDEEAVRDHFEEQGLAVDENVRRRTLVPMLRAKKDGLSSDQLEAAKKQALQALPITSNGG